MHHSCVPGYFIYIVSSMLMYTKPQSFKIISLTSSWKVGLLLTCWFGINALINNILDKA